MSSIGYQALALTHVGAFSKVAGPKVFSRDLIGNMSRW